MEGKGESRARTRNQEIENGDTANPDAPHAGGTDERGIYDTEARFWREKETEYELKAKIYKGQAEQFEKNAQEAGDIAARFEAVAAQERLTSSKANDGES